MRKLWPIALAVIVVGFLAGVAIAGRPTPTDSFVLDPSITVVVSDSTPTTRPSRQRPSRQPPRPATTERATTTTRPGTTTTSTAPTTSTGPTTTAAPTTTLQATTTTLAGPRPRDEVRLVIANGDGRFKLASTTAARLRPLGYIIDLADSVKPVDATIIFYRPGFDDEAKIVAKDVGVPNAVVAAYPTNAPEPITTSDDQGDVIVVLGPDAPRVDPVESTSASRLATSMSVGERPEMTLRDYWRVIIRRSWIVIAAIIATAAPAIALSLRQEAIYSADADMLIRILPGESVFGSDQQTVNPDRLLQNEISILEGDDVYFRVKENLGLEDDPPGVIGSSFSDADIINAAVESGDPQTAATLANAYVQAYIDVKREQTVNGMVAASAELQTKITELRGRSTSSTPRSMPAAPTTTRRPRTIVGCSSTSLHCSSSGSINCRSTRRCLPATPNWCGPPLHRSTRSNPLRSARRRWRLWSDCCSGSARRS